MLCCHSVCGDIDKIFEDAAHAVVVDRHPKDDDRCIVDRCVCGLDRSIVRCEIAPITKLEL